MPPGDPAPEGGPREELPLLSARLSAIPIADSTQSPISKKRSRKKTSRGGGPQTRRTIAVLDRIFPEESKKYRGRYPDEDEMPWLDVWDMFCKEYPRYAADHHPSKWGRPSAMVVKRAMGRA